MIEKDFELMEKVRHSCKRTADAMRDKVLSMFGLAFIAVILSWGQTIQLFSLWFVILVWGIYHIVKWRNIQCKVEILDKAIETDETLRAAFYDKGLYY